MKKNIIWCANIALLTVSSMGAKTLSFVDADFNSFVARVVPHSERYRFSAYHDKLSKNIDAQPVETQRKLRSTMHQK